MSRKSKKVPPPAEVSAVLANDAAALKRVIAAGDGIDAADRDGRTALFQAVIDGKEDMVRLLLAGGATPRVHDGAGWTPLHFAAQAWRTGIATMLLDAGAEVDAPDANGNTPLARAAFESRGRGEMTSLLLARGADRLRKSNHGISPQHLAEIISNFDVKQFFR